MEALRAMVDLPEFWFGMVAWAVIIWGVNEFGKQGK